MLQPRLAPLGPGEFLHDRDGARLHGRERLLQLGQSVAVGLQLRRHVADVVIADRRLLGVGPLLRGDRQGREHRGRQPGRLRDRRLVRHRQPEVAEQVVLLRRVLLDRHDELRALRHVHAGPRQQGERVRLAGRAADGPAVLLLRALVEHGRGREAGLLVVGEGGRERHRPGPARLVRRRRLRRRLAVRPPDDLAFLVQQFEPVAGKPLFHAAGRFQSRRGPPASRRRDRPPTTGPSRPWCASPICFRTARRCCRRWRAWLVRRSPVLLCFASPLRATFSDPLKTWTSASDRMRFVARQAMRTNRPAGLADAGGTISAVIRDTTKLPAAWPGPMPGSSASVKASSLRP